MMNNKIEYKKFGITNRIREHILRIGKSHGFGIQSPWAYNFITEVIGERLPYYEYEQIEHEFRDHQEQRFQKLMLRIRNFVYPHKLVVIDDIHMLTDEKLEQIISGISTKGAIVVCGIWRDSKNFSHWEKLQLRKDIGITFDLYDFGICFLDTNIYKQHYRLNF